MISLGVWCWEFVWRHCLSRRRLQDALLQSRHPQSPYSFISTSLLLYIYLYHHIGAKQISGIIVKYQNIFVKTRYPVLKVYQYLWQS